MTDAAETPTTTAPDAPGPPWLRSPLARYGVALFATAIALGLTALFTPIAERSVFLFFLAAVVSSAWFGGIAPALLATVLSVLAADYLFTRPLYTFGPPTRGDEIALAVFTVLSVVASSLSASLRSARQEAERASAAATLLARQLQERARELERRIEESQVLGAELAQTNEQLAGAVRRAEEASAAALAAERHRTAILESIGDAFVALDPGWRCTYINDVAAQKLQALGYEPDALFGRPLWDAAPALVGSGFEHAVRRAEAEQTLVEYEDYCAPLQRWFQMRIYPAAEGMSIHTRDVTERRQVEEAQRILLDAARLLASSLDLDATIAHVTGLLVPRFADYCVVYLLEDGGTPRQVGGRHAEPTKQPLLDALQRRWRADRVSPQSPTLTALRTTEPVLGPVVSEPERQALSDDPVVRGLLEQLSPISYMAVPLVARGQTIGAITLVSSISGRHFGDEDLAVVELLGARAALALDNARLHAETQRAHERAIRASQLEAQLARARLDVLRAQLNPHFLFNTLNTIAMLVRRDANADALRGIVSLSTLLRQVLDGRGHAEVMLRDELTLAERYLEIEQLRFRDRLQVQLAIEAEALEAYVPAMLLQPLVENAVRHGLAGKPGRGRIEIVVRCRRRRLTIEVRDDGPGFPAGWDVGDPKGMGLASTRERLRQLYGDAQRLAISTAPGGGAVVAVEIPYSPTRITRREPVQ